MTQVRLTNYESSVGTGVKVINKEQTSYTISTTDLEGCNHLIVQCKGISGNMTVNNSRPNLESMQKSLGLTQKSNLIQDRLCI